MRFMPKTLAPHPPPASENDLAGNTPSHRVSYQTMKHLLLSLILLAGCQASDNPVEIGTVKWSRDLDKTLSASKKSEKPVLILFQEVPG